MRGITEAEISPERSPMAPEDEEISLLAILIVLAKRKSLLIKTVLILVLLTVGIVLLLPNEYTATTSLLPPQQGLSSGSGLLNQLSGLSSLGAMMGSPLSLKNPSDLQVALLKSDTVENALIERFHLMDRYHAKRLSQARKMLENMVSIENGAKDGLIRISVTDRDPNRAAEMANGYVEEFKKFSATLAVTEASQRRLFFEHQLGQAKNQLSDAEEQLKKMEQTTGVLQIDAQTRAVIESVAQLRAQIAAKQVQIQAMSSFATPDNPQLQVAEQELAALQAQQAKLGASSGNNDSGFLVPKGNMQQNQLEYVRRLRDVKYYETIFELLARQYEAAKVDEARQGAEIQVVDRAMVPDHHSSPKRTLIVIGAAFLSIFIAMGWALVSEGYERISRNPVENVRLQTLKSLLRLRRRARG